MWFSLSGPRGMPDGLTQRLNREVIAALHRPDVRGRLDRDAVLAPPLTPAALAAFLERRSPDGRRWCGKAGLRWSRDRRRPRTATVAFFRPRI
jgi:hypothetical protein